MPSAVDGAEIRSAVRFAALGAGARRDRAEDLTLAAWEVVLNAIEHGGAPPVITIGVSRDRVTVRVAEPGANGGGRRPTGGGRHLVDRWAQRGRGRHIIRSLTDDLRSFHGPDGTYIEVAIRLPG
jgi:anti-sigma regulatory factor (Ser/Thr protein kinase)